MNDDQQADDLALLEWLDIHPTDVTPTVKVRDDPAFDAVYHVLCTAHRINEDGTKTPLLSDLTALSVTYAVFTTIRRMSPPRLDANP